MSSSSSQNNILLRFVKLTDNARSPTCGSPRSAGLDLYSACNATVPARGKELILTKLQIPLPECSYGRIAPSSGLALAHHIHIGGGEIDKHYRGNIGVIIYHHSDNPFVVSSGDRIAQLICGKIYYPTLEEVKLLDDNVRGAEGFGS